MENQPFKLKRLGDESEKTSSPPETIESTAECEDISPIQKSPLRLAKRVQAETSELSKDKPSEISQAQNTYLPTCKKCKMKLASASAILCLNCGYKDVDEQSEPVKNTWLGSLIPEKEAIICAIIGGVIAYLIFNHFPFLYYILSTVGTLLHEFGHAMWGWFMGHPSIPAFDFTHGGGVTIQMGDKPNYLITGAFIGGFIYAIYYFRQYKLIALLFLSLISIIVCGQVFEWQSILIIYGGHATEAIFGMLCLYRGLSNVSVHHSVERALYFFLGYFMLFNEYVFSNKLKDDPAYLDWYKEGKDGIANDFDRLADIFHTNIETIANFHTFFVFVNFGLAYFAYVVAMRLYSRDTN
jgi:hypothetical protein